MSRMPATRHGRLSKARTLCADNVSYRIANACYKGVKTVIRHTGRVEVQHHTTVKTMNKRPLLGSTLAIAALGLPALAASTSALARVDVDVNIGAPAPVYVAPAPVYAPPPPVYVAPAYGPRPVVVAPVVIGWHGDRYWDGGRWYSRREWHDHGRHNGHYAGHDDRGHDRGPHHH